MTTTPPSLELSSRALARASLLAMLVASAVLVVAVLPAEYGIDPTGAGKALGLLRAPLDRSEPDIAPAADAAMTPVLEGPSSQYAAPYRVDALSLTLGPYEFVEYKYRLVTGANLVFAWEATAPLIQDFHGAPDGKGPEAEMSVDKGTRQRASGALTAPFAGMHGWYWENPGGTAVTVTLHAAGFFTESVERRSNGSKRLRLLELPGAVLPTATSR
jgi:hypothetical protein